MNKKKICIDISNIVPGKGGSGGGIATYSLHLIKSLDQACDTGNLFICCIKNINFTGFEECQNIQFINTSLNTQNFILRFFWIQIYLPFFCIRYKINLLHRVTPELPLIKFCRYICTLHDLMFDYYISNKNIRRFLSRADLIKFYIFRIITKHALKTSDAVIVPCHAIKNEVTEKYKTRDTKIFPIYEAAESSNNHIDFKSNLTSPILNIGVIAGFYPHKGHLKVLELAHKLIQSDFKEFKIYFRGNPAFPNYIEEVNNFKEKLSLNDYVFFIPFASVVKLEDIYSKFDLVLLLSEYEGFGLPVLEAQANNLPVFCSNIPVFKEILGNSAYYVEGNLCNISVEKLIKSFKDQNVLNSFKRLGLFNSKKYSWERMSLETNNLYVKIIENN